MKLYLTFMKRILARARIFFIIFVFLYLGVTPIYAQVVINEVLPDPSGDEAQDEWIELFNTSGAGIDVNGYRLKDAANHELEIDSSHTNGSTIVPSGGWLVVYRRGSASFSLNNTDSETISIFDTTTSDPLNAFSYDDSDEDKSWGRIPDGASIHNGILNPTPGSANQLPAPTPDPTPEPEEPEDPDPTLQASPKATASPTPVASPRKASPKPTPKPTYSPSPQPSGQVLGEADTSPSPIISMSPKEATSSARSFPVGFLFVGAGTLFSAAGGFLLFKKMEKPKLV